MTAGTAFTSHPIVRRAAAFVLAVLFTVIIRDQEADVEIEPTYAVVAADARIHRGPHPSFPAIGVIKAGAEVTFIGHAHGWLRVAVSGEAAGWISRKPLRTPPTPHASFTLVNAVRNPAETTHVPHEYDGWWRRK